MTSDLRTVTKDKIRNWHIQLNERLEKQIKKYTVIIDTYQKTTGYDFNKADSLTIIYQTTNSSSFADFIIWSSKDTLKSTNTLALSKEINNGGGRLEPLKEGATQFKVYKTYNDNMTEYFLELTFKSDTVYAYNAAIYCPVDGGVRSIILTAKKAKGKYRIQDYYLHESGFVAVPPK